MWPWLTTKGEKEPLLQNQKSRDNDNSSSNFTMLPKDIIIHIASYLNYPESSALAVTSRQMLSIIDTSKPMGGKCTYAETRNVLNQNRPKIQEINSIKATPTHISKITHRYGTI